MNAQLSIRIFRRTRGGSEPATDRVWTYTAPLSFFPHAGMRIDLGVPKIPLIRVQDLSEAQRHAISEASSIWVELGNGVYDVRRQLFLADAQWFVSGDQVEEGVNLLEALEALGTVGSPWSKLGSFPF